MNKMRDGVRAVTLCITPLTACFRCPTTMVTIITVVEEVAGNREASKAIMEAKITALGSKEDSKAVMEVMITALDNREDSKVDMEVTTTVLDNREASREAMAVEETFLREESKSPNEK